MNTITYCGYEFEYYYIYTQNLLDPFLDTVNTSKVYFGVSSFLFFSLFWCKPIKPLLGVKI